MVCAETPPMLLLVMQLLASSASATANRSDDTNLTQFQHGRRLLGCSPGCKVEMQMDGRLVSCGFRTGNECPRNYTANEVIESAATWGEDSQVSAQKYSRVQGEAACAQARGRFTALASGGWCLANREPRLGAGAGAGGELPHGHLGPNPGVVAWLHHLLSAPVALRQESHTPAIRQWSLSDWGAGVGQYGRALLAIDNRTLYQAYDGAGNVESFTQGFVRYADMTTPLSFPRTDWVLSFEAGEHVPHQHERIFVRNLHAHNCRGVIISWAFLNQGGSSHINTHDPLYVRTLFEELGYVFEPQLSAQLDAAHRGAWNGPTSAGAELCVGMFAPPSKKFYPCSTHQVLVRKTPLGRGECGRHAGRKKDANKP